jgi:hypothetical protein
MNSRKLLVMLGMLLVSMWAMAGEGAKTAKSDAAAMFDRLKALEGEWESQSPDMGRVRAVYKVVGGGSAVEDHFSGEKIPGGEMITLYHLDGDRLVLTHYCAAQNQPRMVAKRIDPVKGEVDFQFLDATNLANPNAGHMRNARIQLVDANHFNSQWEFFQDGKLRNTESGKYTRVR